MATRAQWVLLAALALLAPIACDGDPSRCCPGPVTQRCLWNNDTNQFDKACTYSCGCASDGGLCVIGDGGAVPEARTTYYSNDPRLQECRY